MLKAPRRAVVLLAAITQAGMVAAQTSPTPGPTNPTPQTDPFAKPRAGLVINPTEEDCRRGWRPGLKWKKQQFDEFCTQLRASK